MTDAPRSLYPLLQQIVAEETFNPIAHPALLSTLAEELLADRSRAIAFNITPETVNDGVERRAQLLNSLYPTLQSFCCETLQWRSVPLDLAWHLWIPLALRLADTRRSLNRPLIQGILGGQGTGKTTLATILGQILTHLGYRVCQLSLDDLYKTYTERQQLQQVDPRLRWRGPPGTHDIDLGLQVLQQIHQGGEQPIALPRFDKSAWGGIGDRTTPEIVTQVDILLFEGWFVGMRPINPAAFEMAPSPIRTESDRTFARDMNVKLQDYLPLWDELDRLIVLYPEDYRLSKQWRMQAEQEMKAKGKPGMEDEEITEFVEYFWRSLHPLLFLTLLLFDPDHVDLAMEIDQNHCIRKIYRPSPLC
jgi:D-glycerate 3-kinase